MADETENAVHILEGQIVEENAIVTNDADSVAVDADVSEDILQQALEEVSQDNFEQSGVVYSESALVSESEHGNVVEDTTNVVYRVVNDDSMPVQTVVTTDQNQQVVNSSLSSVASPTSVVIAPPTSVVIGSPNSTNTALGTSENPIRIVQQGNHYTSMQQLTPEQVSQIMQVLQNQHVAKQTKVSGSGSSVLFNPQTNTRIVYRIINPADLHKNTATTYTKPSPISKIGSGDGSVTKRTYKKRNRDDEEDKVDTPELSKEEKEERKKHRPRTRSGRVSKPPKHMVKDYKHIHTLDWDEDYDDSDGGYSDYKGSGGEEEEGENTKKRDSVYVSTGLGTSKAKHWKCDSCEKSYIGRAGLARHYKLKPDHGHLDPVEGEETTPTTSAANGLNDSNSNDTTPTPTATPVTLVKAAPLPRGRPPQRNYVLETNPQRRKARLKEFVRQCKDEELMEVVLPRLTKVITAWEFMMMKAESSTAKRFQFQELFCQYETVYKQMMKMCKECLKPVENEQAVNVSNRKLQIENQAAAESLKLTSPAYEMLGAEVPHEDSEVTFHYKYLTSDPSNLNTATSAKRTVELVTPGELIREPPKKQLRVQLTDAQGNPTTALVNAVSPENLISEDQAPEETVDQSENIEQAQDEDQTEASQSEVVAESQNGQVITQYEGQEFEGHQVLEGIELEQGPSILRLDDGLILIQNVDGSTVQLQADQNIPLETVQALLAMENEGQIHIEQAEVSEASENNEVNNTEVSEV